LKGKFLQVNVLEVVLSDIHHAGVTDAVAENPFNFFESKILNPFDTLSEEVQHNTQSISVKNEDSDKASKNTSKISKVEKTLSKSEPDRVRDVSDLVWSFGGAAAPVQVVVSSSAGKGEHPLSIQAKALFEKMLQSIGLNENSVSYIVLNRADKYSSAEKLQVKESMNNYGESAYKLFVGEEAVKCLFDQTLVRARQCNMDFSGKPCGLVMHPESLMTQPVLKKLAWQDLLKFQSLTKGLAL
tara:strand:+ start:813 stop:1538 length:726 start_codon:yes stop_codon:yes gene_type:complete